MHVRFALANAFSFAAYSAAFWGWGLLVPGMSLRALWRPAVGVGLSAIVATLGYRIGCPMGYVGRVIFAVGLVGLLVGLKRARAMPASGPARLVLLIGAGVALLVWLPALIGGAQFAIFQANAYDQFNYLTCAATYLRESYATVMAQATADVLRDPLIPNAYFMLVQRPAVMELFAGLDGIAPGALYLSYYGFLGALVLASFCAVTGLIRTLFGDERRCAPMIAAAVVLGYWGQLQFDLNAWSWTAATPVLLAMLGLTAELLHPAQRTGAPGTDGPRVVALSVCMAGVGYLYPEMGMFLLPAMLLGLIATGWTDRAVWRGLRPLGWAVGGAMLLLLPAAKSITSFALAQVRWASGLDASPLAWLWQTMVGPAPVRSFDPGWWLSCAAGIGGLGWLPGTVLHFTGELLVVAAGVAGATRVIQLGRNRPHVLFLAITAGAAVAAVLLCAARGHWWVAAKGLSYAAIIGLPLLLAPVALRRFRLASLPAWGLLGAQLAFGVMRLWSSADADGIHHRGWVYPAVTDPVLKTARVWAVGDAHDALRGSRGLKIDVPDMWLENYALVIANANDVDFFKTTPVTNLWRFTNRSLGLQPVIRDFDTLAYLEYDFVRARAGLGLARRDGRIYSTRPGPRLTWIETGAPLDTQDGMLAWTMGSEPALRSTLLVVEADRAMDGVFRLSVAAPPVWQRHAWLRFRRAGNTLQTVAVEAMGPGLVQGISVPLTLTEGKNVIEIQFQTGSDAANFPATLTLINPMVERRP